MRYFIVIPLEPVTKKNSQRVVKNRQTGAHFIIPSLKFERYQKDVGSYFTYQKIKPIEPEFYPVSKSIFAHTTPDSAASFFVR